MYTIDDDHLELNESEINELEPNLQVYLRFQKSLSLKPHFKKKLTKMNTSVEKDSSLMNEFPTPRKTTKYLGTLQKSNTSNTVGFKRSNQLLNVKKNS